MEQKKDNVILSLIIKDKREGEYMAKQLGFDFCRLKRSPILDALDDSSKEDLLHVMAGVIIHYFKRAKEEKNDKGAQSQDNTGAPEQEGDYLYSAIIGETGSK